jgi:hypothetical protein
LGFVGWLGYNLDPLDPGRADGDLGAYRQPLRADDGALPRRIRVGMRARGGAHLAMGELLVPASIGIFTDAAGLLVLTVSSIPLIAKLGYFCAFWSFSNLITVAVLVPLVLSVPAGAQGVDGSPRRSTMPTPAHGMTLALFLTSRGALRRRSSPARWCWRVAGLGLREDRHRRGEAGLADPVPGFRVQRRGARASPHRLCRRQPAQHLLRRRRA